MDRFRHGPSRLILVPDERAERQETKRHASKGRARRLERAVDLPVYAAMLRRLKKQMREFRAGEPGERFQAHYRSRQKSADKRASWTRILNFILAAVSFVLGIVFSIIPGVPGFVFFFVSAALLAAESFRTAQFLDLTEVKIRDGWKRIRRRRRKVAPALSHAPARLRRAVK